MRTFLRFEGRRVACRRCRRVKTERLEWLAENPPRPPPVRGPRGPTVSRNDHQAGGDATAPDLESGQGSGEAVHAALPARSPKAEPLAIEIDEMSIHKRHTYLIVVSDLEAQRPIWFGGMPAFSAR